MRALLRRRKREAVPSPARARAARLEPLGALPWDEWRARCQAEDERNYRDHQDQVRFVGSVSPLLEVLRFAYRRREIRRVLDALGDEVLGVPRPDQLDGYVILPGSVVPLGGPVGLTWDWPHLPRVDVVHGPVDPRLNAFPLS